MVSVVIVAGGKGTRMGADKNKVLLSVLDKEIIAWTIEAFDNSNSIDEIIVVTGESDIETVRDIVHRNKFTKVTHITSGGDTRRESAYNGLRLVSGDYVLIHDGARCLISSDEIKRVTNDTISYGAAALGVKVKDTLKTIDDDGNIIATVDREKTVHIHTPQGFISEEILKFHEKAKSDNIEATDDCLIFEHYGKMVHLTWGSYDNIKITTPADMVIAENILKGRSL